MEYGMMARWISSFWILFGIVAARKEYLLDTTELDNLGWTTYPGSTGWREASFTTSTSTGNSQTYRVYAVCQVAQPNVNNWLRLPYIRRQGANRLFIETKFTMRECTRHPNPNHLQQCKEKFNLLYYEADSDFANAMMPTWDTMSYRHIDAIAADREFSDINNAAINTKTREIPVTLNGVYFAYQDTGACMSLISVKIYYIYCDAITINFAKFERTLTGSESTSIEQQKGTCVENAEVDRDPTYLCRADGTWYLNSGGCKCKPGFQPDKSKGDTACIECQPGFYKYQKGSQECQLCPDRSYAYQKRAISCKCLDGYFRALSDQPSTACAQPPSAPRNISRRFVDQNMAILQWLAPDSSGGRSDLYYSVECRGCSNQVRYTPSKSDLQQTRVTVIGLEPNTPYTITVYARNGVSKISNTEWDFYQTIEFTTQASVPSKVENVHVIERGGTYIVLGWEKPRDSNIIEKYEVKFYPTDQASNGSTIETVALNHPFKNLKANTRFAFQVRGKTARGWGEYSSTFYSSTVTGGGKTEPGVDAGDGVTRVGNKDESSPVWIIAGAIVAVFVCLAIVIGIFVIIFKRNNPTCNEKTPQDCETLQYSNMNFPVHCGITEMNGGMTLPLFHVPGTVRSYVDPHQYEDPTEAVREFTKEIDAQHITIESVIGGGEFGDVCKGMLRLPGRQDMCVAIKTLKPGASEKNRLDFLTEASIMGQFEDPNVIYLEGVVTKSKHNLSHPIMIVTEYMANGSLDTFLRNNDGHFTVLQLTAMLRGIAAGMKYLSEMGYVHRDLAARNILVNENLVCKVADFGLSREIETESSDGAYTTKGGKIPVRWTAPEAISYRKFTSASDVWSYGVVMWEVISYGERPYWNWSNQDVIKAVDKGYRLPPPMDCPEACHQLMLDCWQKERSHRPKFALIVLALDKLIQAPELLHRLAQFRPPSESSDFDLSHCENVADWLTCLQMEHYIQLFHSFGFVNTQDLQRLTLQDLQNMGITLLGHQKRLLNSVHGTRQGVQVSEGFLV